MTTKREEIDAMKRNLTKPRQAGSSRTLDRWQLLAERALRYMAMGQYKAADDALAKLVVSIRKAERR